ncbi:S26 family signal peptidase [Pontibacter sp. CAU 1760]
MSFKFWKKGNPNKQKSVTREWANAALFAVVFATLIRWTSFERYAIPSSSMEGSLLVGDYIYVSKLHYGPRTPATLLQVPLTHQKLWGTALPAYSDLTGFNHTACPAFLLSIATMP